LHETGSDNIITLSNKCFGLIDIDQRWLEANRTAKREWKDLTVVIPTIHGTSFCGLSFSFAMSLLDMSD
jgi:hypothetical protein